MSSFLKLIGRQSDPSRLMDSSGKATRPDVLRLVLLFCASFALPLFLLSLFLRSGPAVTPSPGENEIAQEEKLLFPNALTFTGGVEYLEVVEAEDLLPKVGEDFLLTGWFRLRKLPAEGDNVVMLAHSEIDSSSNRGYALSLERHGSLLRPRIYWRDSDKQGGWYTFGGLEVEPRQWFMLAASFHDNNKLGLHALVHKNGEIKTEVLGGYELEELVVPESDSRLLIGAFHAKKFNGKIGPVGIFRSESISSVLNAALESFRESPLELPSQIEMSWVRFWTPDGKKDLSSFARKIKLSRDGKVNKKKSKQRKKKRSETK